MSRDKSLIAEENRAVCTLTLNRPEKRNLLSPDILVALSSELGRLKEENKVRCVVITGAGDKAFSSGYDINALGNNDLMRDYEDGHPLISAVQAIENFPYPVIAMINGHAFGAGLEIAVTCDLRISANNCQFAMPPAKLGVVYTYSGLRKFLNLIGPGYVKELFLVGSPINSKRAREMGLVNYVVSADELKQFTYSMAEDIAENAPLSLKTLKETVNAWIRSQTLSPEDDELIKTLTSEVQNSEDYKEGQRSFAQKRKPVFKGK